MRWNGCGLQAKAIDGCPLYPRATRLFLVLAFLGAAVVATTRALPVSATREELAHVEHEAAHGSKRALVTGAKGMQFERALEEQDSRASKKGSQDVGFSVEVASEHVPDEILSLQDYLNALVNISVANSANQLGNIVFVKTHKTASTTLAAILYRYAYRHHLKLAHFGKWTTANLADAAKQVQETNERVDVFHYHISPTGQYHGTWPEAHAHFQEIMRDPDNVNYVTVMREPRSHLLSYYYYYMQPNNQMSLEEFLQDDQNLTNEGHRRIRNPICAEFGAHSEEEVQHLIDNVIPSFNLIILTDHLDEGLVLLKHMLGWHLIDATYMILNETKEGQHRWDGKPFVTRPSFEDVPKELQDKIDNLTKLDQKLYEAGKKHFEERIASVGGSMEGDLADFKLLQNTVVSYLDAHPQSGANAMYRAMGVYLDPPPAMPF